MACGFLHRPTAHVGFFIFGIARDAVIFDAGIDAQAVRGNIRTDIFKIQFKTDIAVEFTIVRITRIPLDGRPNLLGGFDITAKRGHTARTEDRSKNPVLRPWRGMKNAVRVGQEITDPLLLEVFVHARIITALGKPNADRTPAEHFFIKLRRGLDLPANSPFVAADERQETVRRGTRDDLQMSVILEFSEGLREIFVITIQKSIFGAGKFPIIVQCGLVELLLETRPFDLFIG